MARRAEVPYHLQHQAKAPGPYLAELLRIAGGPEALARKLGKNPSTVYRWMRRFDVTTWRP